MTDNRYHINNLKPFSFNERKFMLRAESSLWRNVLKEMKLKDKKFIKQKKVSRFITDYFCKELMMIIEIIGNTHYFGDVCDRDLVRLRKLESSGFKVVRFKDTYILKNIENVRKEIERVILELEENPPNITYKFVVINK